MRRFFHSLILILSTSSLCVANETDLLVQDKTLVQRCVINGPSSRMIAVGQPGGFNYAFDALHCAPVYVWNGGFLDMGGETIGRGGKGCKILGVAQPLGTDKLPLRAGKPDTLPRSLRFQGYRRNSQTGDPTFLFELDGEPIEQSLHRSGPAIITTELTFSEKKKTVHYYLLDPTNHLSIDLSAGLRWSGPGIIEIPSRIRKAAITIHLKSTDQTFVREVENLSGIELYKNYCSACHSTDGTKLIGPSFKDLWGRREVVIREGQAESISVDEAYLRESILAPQAAVVRGYEQIPMADFSTILTPGQVDLLIAYLKGLN